MNILGLLLYIGVAVLVVVIAGVWYLQSQFKKNRRRRYSVGFFHPYWYVSCSSLTYLMFNLYNSDAGGGGERVLWCAVLGNTIYPQFFDHVL
jgi:hypothetical protein